MHCAHTFIHETIHPYTHIITASREAAIAASIVGIPSIALLTFAGPGAWHETVRQKVLEENSTFDEFERASRTFAANVSAVKELNSQFPGLNLITTRFCHGELDPLPAITICSTTESLRTLETPELKDAIRASGGKSYYARSRDHD